MARTAWARSIRFRMTVLYSSVLFVLAALLVGALYLGLSYSLRDEPVSSRDAVVELSLGSVDGVEGGIFVDSRAFEREVNEHTLDSLRNVSLGALGALFVASLAVGWVIAGRALAPIERIGGVAREIEATNLSRRIELEGPEDELRRLADTFDAMLDRLDAAFSAQRRFVADASHELRNPLAIVRTNAELTVADERATHAIRRRSERIRRASDRMRRLVDDLLTLARLEGTAARREDVDLDELLGETADELGDEATAKGIRLERSVTPAGATVIADRGGLKRVLANLLDNALRHAPSGSSVRVGAGRNGSWAFLTVADDGPGIALEQQARIFDRFYRVDGARSRAEGGSGLGLAIVREITEAHQGRVRLLSAPGSGAVFVVWLPLKPGAGEPPDADPGDLAAATAAQP
jgi:signal transduction histidine kinase